VKEKENTKKTVRMQNREPSIIGNDGSMGVAKDEEEGKDADTTVESGFLKNVFGIGRIVSAKAPQTDTSDETGPSKTEAREPKSHHEPTRRQSLAQPRSVSDPASVTSFASTSKRKGSQKHSATTPAVLATPQLPIVEGNPFDSIAVQATPSLLNAIQRISAAQQAAKTWRARATAQQQQHQTMDGSVRGKEETGEDIGLGLPKRDDEMLKFAAKRRQSSAEWWREVEKKAGAVAPTYTSTGARRIQSPS